MREILYIQAGSFANYTGTHFWNTQEEYFTYDDETEPLVNHDISFREGIDRRGDQTYCPRLLVFDVRGNFGSLSAAKSLYCHEDQSVGSSSQAEESIWDGDILAYKQEPISSTQPTKHDAPRVGSSPEARINNEVEDTQDGLKESLSKVSSWSDFARVSYIPRSIQKIPDSPDGDHLNGNWGVGRKAFLQYNEETDLMDGAVRRSLEECDSPQGIQIIEDTLTFGSFIDSFINSFRDEFSRLPILSFPLLSQSIPTRSGTEGLRDLKFMINDALVLRTYNDMDSALAVPISTSAAWTFPETADKPSVDIYSASATLCSHLESSTLPLRNRPTPLSLTSLLAQLNWRGINRFSHLSGAFLSKPTERFDGSLSVSDFSLPANKVRDDQYVSPCATLFAISDVTRGLTPEELIAYDKWRSQGPPSFSSGTSFHAPSYPSSEGLPSAKALTGPSSQTPLPAENCPGRLFTRMTTTTETAAMFDAYASLIHNEITRKPGLVVQSSGLDLDELKELVGDLWTIHDNYHDETLNYEGLDDGE
ncbi:tubulin nucleotide-binding domain-like protein [Pleurotus eryngii]|uniref:Tubulin nucleotide-binding domain-like protein n=1 Tax=Pleurotus eryngii TaxID=5323 RepID=A0A9P5ZVH7_PLEER|nr:tubulin nucleotide-binding domain-like protein [Pleurotus eryngii]